MVERGDDFLFGPPPGINKSHGVHRDVLIPKLEPRIEIYAKKLRDFYLREGILPDDKTYIEPVRARLPSDTLEFLIPNK